MRKLVLLALLIGSFKSQAQNTLPAIYDTLERKMDIIIDGGMYLGTTSMYNSLTGKFLFGGDITAEIKDASFGQHNASNRAGVYANPTISAIFYNSIPLKKYDWGLSFKLGSVIHAGTRYTDDLFGLAMYGNQRYLGESIDLSNTSISASTAQKLSVGIISEKSKSSVHLNIYGLNSFSRAYIQNGNLNQDEDGFNVNLLLNGNFERAIGSQYYKGIGVGFDANFILPVQFSEKTAFFQLELNDLGVGIYTSDFERYTIDENLSFDGLKFNQIMGDNSILNNEFKLLDELGVSRDTIKGGVKPLPFSFNVSKIIDELNTSKLQAFYGFQGIVNYGIVPNVFAGVQYRINDIFRVGAQANYGGYSTFKGGLYVQSKFEKLNFGLALNDIVGTVSSKGKGYAYSLRLNYRL